MGTNLSLAKFTELFNTFLKRYHAIIFVLIVIGSLAVAMLILNAIIIRSTDTSEFDSAANTTTFDQTTITRLERLKTTGDGSTYTPPAGRINPFVE